MRANFYFKTHAIEIAKSGNITPSRPHYADGSPTKSISIKQVFEKYNLAKESVINNYRPTAIKSAIQEILWIYQDQSNRLEDAHKRGVTWWDEFNIGNGTIGKAYGYVVNTFNLTECLLDGMINNPFSRRHILNLWQSVQNKLQLNEGGLLPCAYETIWSIDSNYNVSLHLNQRSSDFLMANNINKIQYVALGLMICGHLTFHTGKKHTLTSFSYYVMDLHIYDRHITALQELLERKPSTTPQTIELDRICDFYDYRIDDFKINKTDIPPLINTLELAI